MKTGVAVIILAALGILTFFLVRKNSQITEPVFCTQEAKLCPDGSYVGRTGPHCEFAECPSTPDVESYTDPATGASYQYPASLNLTYASFLDWPPMVQVLTTSYTCTEAGNEIDRAGRTEKKTIAGREFCVTIIAEGAAGSTYVQYAYEFEEAGKPVVLTFSIREPQCANYEEPNKSACMEEQDTLDVDSIVGDIAASFNL